MGIFSEADLADFGALAEELALKDDCDILDFTRVMDNQNGYRKSWEVVETVKCAVIAPGTSQTHIIGDQREALAAKTVLLPRLTTLSTSNRLRVAGVTYEILGMPDPTSYEVVRRVPVQKAVT